MYKSFRTAVLSYIAAVTCLVAYTEASHAQAWVGEEKQLEIGFSQGFARSTTVALDPSDPESDIDLGMMSATTSLSASYVPWENVEFYASVASIALKYTGDPAGGHGAYDDGDWHWTPQSAEFGARYQLYLTDSLTFTPSIGIQGPIAKYEWSGIAGAGRRLVGGLVGAAIGFNYTNFFLQAGYILELNEPVNRGDDSVSDISQLQSDVTITASYIFGSKWIVSLGGIARLAHDGLSFDEAWTATQEEHHDLILNEDLYILNASIAVLLGEWTAGISGGRFIAGKNTRDTTQGAITISKTWDFL